MKMTANEIRRDFLLIQISITDKNSFDMKVFQRIADILETFDDKQLESEYEKNGMVSIEDIVLFNLKNLHIKQVYH